MEWNFTHTQKKTNSQKGGSSISVKNKLWRSSDYIGFSQNIQYTDTRNRQYKMNSFQFHCMHYLLLAIIWIVWISFKTQWNFRKLIFARSCLFVFWGRKKKSMHKYNNNKNRAFKSNLIIIKHEKYLVKYFLFVFISGAFASFRKFVFATRQNSLLPRVLCSLFQLE